MAYPGEGSEGPGPPTIFRPNWGPKGRKIFFWPPPLLSQGLGVCTGSKGCTDETGFHQLDTYDHSLVKWFFFLQASKGSLHGAAVSGQHETVKELLESIEDVDQSDEVLVSFSLCKSNVMPSLSRSLYLRILFVHSQNNKITRTVWNASE